MHGKIKRSFLVSLHCQLKGIVHYSFQYCYLSIIINSNSFIDSATIFCNVEIVTFRLFFPSSPFIYSAMSFCNLAMGFCRYVSFSFLPPSLIVQS